MEKEICAQLQEQDKLGLGLRGLFGIIFSFLYSFSWVIPQPQALAAVVLCVRVLLCSPCPSTPGSAPEPIHFQGSLPEGQLSRDLGMLSCSPTAWDGHGGESGIGIQRRERPGGAEERVNPALKLREQRSRNHPAGFAGLGAGEQQNHTSSTWFLPKPFF